LFTSLDHFDHRPPSTGNPAGKEGHESREGHLRLLRAARGNPQPRVLHRRHRQSDVHNIYELFAALAVSLIATVLKFGDRTQIGAVHLATSLVADLQLIAAGVVWVWAEEISTAGVTVASTASVVSLSGGALLANLVSVVLLVIETVTFHRG
jgi:hypothetical protein